MRKKMSWIFPVFAIAVGGVLSLSGCLKDTVTETHKYTLYTPVYTLKASLLAAINGDPGQPIVQAGQIYIKGSFIYLNDVGKGIHIIDNSDPTHPVQTAFLNIPGNTNIAIRGNILYTDMYSDLLSIDISNPHQVKIIGKMWGFFPYRSFYNQDSNYVLTSWITKDTLVKTLLPGKGLYLVPGTVFYTLNSSAASAAASYAGTGTGSAGTAGSEAAMTLIGDYLYAIPEPHSISVVEVSDSTHPTLISNTSAGYDLETIFPLQDKLLVGSKEGVYIYSIDNTSHQPIVLGSFQHGTACDPVIADQQYAYVTLRSGTGCGGTANELDVLSAQEIASAAILKTYPMTSPSGLGKDGSLLFVCDGPAVKVFDATDPTHLQLLSQVSVDKAYDVIATNHLLLVVGGGGIYEYDYHDPANMVLLSHLSAN